MNAITLSLWENILWGLIHFDQFTYPYKNIEDNENILDFDQFTYPYKNIEDNENILDGEKGIAFSSTTTTKSHLEGRSVSSVINSLSQITF